MSCAYCNLKQGSFKTEKNYMDLMREVNFLVNKNILVNLGEIEQESPFIKTQYKCNKCGQCWILKTPDQAFRGGWCENKQ